MNISDYGGEFKLIKAVTKPAKYHLTITGVGDDCAVLPWNKDKYLLVTKDMLIEEDHFSLRYFEPEDIGRKVVESNISDIAAMGGTPKHAFIGLSLRQNISIEWVKKLYKGMYFRFKKHQVDLVGGDTTHSSVVAISLTLLGEVKKKHLVLRRGAQVGNVIKISGKVGASTAGFKMLQKNKLGHDWVKQKHRKPTCRLDIAGNIAKYATAMADISDGISADLKNIINMSNVGAVIEKQLIPIDKRTFEAAKSLGEDAYDFALYGGEDFELIYTVPKKWESKSPGISIGEIIKGKKLFLRENDKMSKVTRLGFDHFNR